MIVVAAHGDPELPGGRVRDREVGVHGAREHQRGVHAVVPTVDHLAPFGHGQLHIRVLPHPLRGELALIVRRPVRMRRELSESGTDAVVVEQPFRVVLLGVDRLVLTGLRRRDEGVQAAVGEGVDHHGGEVTDLLRLVVAAFLTGRVPGPLRFVDRADEPEVDAFLVAEVPDHVEQIPGELLVMLHREIRGAGVAVGVPVRGESPRRGVHEGDEVLDAVFLRGLEEPSRGGVAVPVIGARPGLEGFRGAPGVVDRVVDSAADVVPVLGQADPLRTGEQQPRHPVPPRRGPGAEVLRPPGSGGAEALDLLVEDLRIDRDPVVAGRRGVALVPCESRGPRHDASADGEPGGHARAEESAPAETS